MSVQTLTINDQLVSAREEETILQAAEDAGIRIPTLCHLEGVSDVGACRLCLVEIAGSHKLQPACVTKVAEGMKVSTNSDRLQKYRRTIVEMLFAEGNHVCSVCVANGNCELQNLAIEMGMDHVRLEYQFPHRQVDISHERFGLDHNRCVLCTRCVRVCDEIEGAILVSFGDCAVTGNVTALRNSLGSAGPVLQRCYIEASDIHSTIPHEPGIVPTLLDRVEPVHRVVPVDIYLPGCPPSATQIKAVLEPLLRGETPQLEGREFIKFG